MAQRLRSQLCWAYVAIAILSVIIIALISELLVISPQRPVRQVFQGRKQDLPVTVPDYVARCLTPAPILREMERMLVDVTNALTEVGAVFWIEQGTLLGALRFASFLPYDDDIDLGMMEYEFERIRRPLEGLLRNKSYATYHFEPQDGRDLLVQIFFASSRTDGSDRPARSQLLDELHTDIFLYKRVQPTHRRVTSVGSGADGDRKPLAHVLQFVSKSWHDSFSLHFPTYALSHGIPEKYFFSGSNDLLPEEGEAASNSRPGLATGSALRFLTMNGRLFPVPFDSWEIVRRVVSRHASIAHIVMEQHHRGPCEGFVARTENIIATDNTSLMVLLSHLEGAFSGRYRRENSAIYHLAVSRANPVT